MNQLSRHGAWRLLAIALFAMLVLMLIQATGRRAAAGAEQPNAQISKKHKKKPKCRLNFQQPLPPCATPRVLGLWARTQHYVPCPWVWGEVEKRVAQFRAEVTARGWGIESSNGSYICRAPDPSNMLVKNGLGRVTASNPTFSPVPISWYWTQVVTLTRKGVFRSTFSMGAPPYIDPCDNDTGAILCPFLPSFVPGASQ